MSTTGEQKIQVLLDQHKPGTVCLASWLESLGISHDLQKRYRRSGWLAAIGKGAFVRPNDTVDWQGGLYALQTQASLPIHVGALTALSMLGFAHYIRMGTQQVVLFAQLKTAYPAWFKNHDWGSHITLVRTSILPTSLGVTEHQQKTFSILLSSPERALLESLHLAPDTVDLVECAQVIEGLTTLRPQILQPLLEQCSSIKVKRLFLFLASRTGHAWVKRLDTSKLDLGTGDRTITKGGVYVSLYGITVPRELVHQ